ncbi:DsrE family protein [Robiginitalea sp. IMCC44478]|uniref:DsrE family protein n=1 Tax=Robiginitalea sp. IMCC44478 TaxID=3459122 RepID=UPI00404238D5
MRIYSRLVLILFCLSFFTLSSQEKQTGPVIEEYGAIWDIQNTSYPVNKEHLFKVVFDVMRSPDSKEAINPSLETAARFLNMHARKGVSMDQMQVAVVVHNAATPDILTNDHYRERFGTDNPNTGLLNALMDAGVKIILCGQSSVARKVPIEQAQPGVLLSLSAMTALIQLQSDGYQLIKF